MTSKFSIDNRELLQRISSGEAVVGIDFGNLIVRELAAFRLAAMDSEPVAWTDEQELRDVNVVGIGYLFGIDREANKFADPRRQIMLYRHAHPVPVSVPDEIQKLKDGRGFKYVKDGVHYSVNYANGWNQCRAAMLAAATQEVKP
ncbi:TPA: hypothetical protein N3K52_003525 [Klebsiella pneumoniae]|nr:hypothetical protein [Klebsiella pneumoniae]